METLFLILEKPNARFLITCKINKLAFTRNVTLTCLCYLNENTSLLYFSLTNLKGFTWDRFKTLHWIPGHPWLLRELLTEVPNFAGLQKPWPSLMAEQVSQGPCCATGDPSVCFGNCLPARESHPEVGSGLPGCQAAVTEAVQHCGKKRSSTLYWLRTRFLRSGHPTKMNYAWFQ